MALNPVPVLVVYALCVVFMLSVYGQTIAEQQFGAMDLADADDCQVHVPGFGDTACAIYKLGSFLTNLLRVVWGATVFLFRALTFDIPGAPIYVRAPLVTMFAAPMIWSAATLARGD